MKKHGWNLWFYIPFALALAAGAGMLLTVKKGEDVLLLNRHHTPFFDTLFYYGTTLGNGLLFLSAAIALSWKSFRAALLALICFAATGLLSQLLKQVVFPGMVRPSVFLAGEPLHFVEGVKMLSHFSFPSGHAAVAFSLFCFLSQFVKIRPLGLAFIVMALIGGISRIYLAQHFFIDVYFGALLGVIVTTLLWHYFENSQAVQSSAFLNQSLKNYFKKE